MAKSPDTTRLALGGLLIAASVAIGAGSDQWGAEPMTDAPMLPTIDVVAPAVNARARERPAARPDADAAAPAARVVAPVVKDSVIAEPAAAGDSVAAAALLVLEGSASWYADALAGRRTASGEPYDPTELIAAHRALPFGTRLRVTNLANDRSVEVRVIDRGPFVTGRIVDLSRRAAEQIGIIRSGHGRVRVEVLEYGG